MINKQKSLSILKMRMILKILSFTNLSLSFQPPPTFKRLDWTMYPCLYLLIKVRLPIQTVSMDKVLEAALLVTEALWLLNNNAPKLCRITSSIYKIFMKDFSCNQIVFSLIIPNKFNATCRKERTRTPTESSMGSSHQPSHTDRKSTIRRCKKWKCLPNARPVWCKWFCKKLTEDQNQSVNKKK